MPHLFENYQPKDSYLRVATACPEVSVADVPTNVRRVTELYHDAVSQNVSLVTFPELSITGYTLGDLVNQTRLLEQAKSGLLQLAIATKDQPAAMIVGLPLQVGSRLYNCAAVVANGNVQGIVPKTHLPNYNEFYEHRWYDSWEGANTTVKLGEEAVPFGTNLLFDVGDTLCGIEICEDLWVLNPPSNELAAKGANLIANPSASPEQIGKAANRRDLVTMQSAKMHGAYIYAGCDPSESTAEIVMGGHQLIAENGKLVAERKPFGDQALTIADIDIDHLKLDRRKHHSAQMLGAVIIDTEIGRHQENLLAHIEPDPFLPNEPTENRVERLDMVLQIQAHGLAMRMKATHQDRLVLGLSGGLDSTLALLVAHKAAQILHIDPYDMIHTLTMPGPGSSGDTQTNAQILAKELNVQNTVISIDEISRLELSLLEHDGTTQDITYENVQARARTSLLFNYGNKNHAIVLGTGDLSEFALGWCTYNGDQQSHYNVNGSIPKTMVRSMVARAAKQPEYRQAAPTLRNILGTMISPELIKNTDSKNISQSTEEIIGPYELHQFSLFHLIRWGDAPDKISYLAKKAFAGSYDPAEIDKWLGVFLERFPGSQFKRENMTNSPKVGSVSLSPRGDWRMPPDLCNAAIWK